MDEDGDINGCSWSFGMTISAKEEHSKYSRRRLSDISVNWMSLMPALYNNIHGRWIIPTHGGIKIRNEYFILSPVIILRVKYKSPPQKKTALHPSIHTCIDRSNGSIKTPASIEKLIDGSYLQPRHGSNSFSNRNAKLADDHEQTELPTNDHYR